MGTGRGAGPQIPKRQAKTTKLFLSPPGWPNAIDIDHDQQRGFWVAEQRHDNKPEAHWLLDWNGKLLHTVMTNCKDTSGMCFGDGFLWSGANGASVVNHPTPPINGVFQTDMNGSKYAMLCVCVCVWWCSVASLARLRIAGPGAEGREVHPVGPGERAGGVGGGDDALRVGDRADRVGGEREGDDPRARAEQRLERVDVEGHVGGAQRCGAHDQPVVLPRPAATARRSRRGRAR